MTGPTTPGGGSYWQDKLRAIGNDKEFRELLGSFQRYTEKTGEEVAEAARAAGGLPLPEAAVTSALTRDELPTLEFVSQFLKACGLSEDGQALWREVRQALEDGRAPLSGRRAPRSRRMAGAPRPRRPPVRSRCLGSCAGTGGSC